MEQQKGFRTGLFGFRKSDVCQYIQEMNTDFSAKLGKQYEEAQALREENFRLKGQLAQLQGEKDKVADALILAEQKAQEIVTATEKEADEKRRSLEADYQEEREKLLAIRAEIAGVRQAALDAIKRFETELHEMEQKAEQKADSLMQKETPAPSAQMAAAPSATEAAQKGITVSPSPSVMRTPVSISTSDRKINIIKLK